MKALSSLLLASATLLAAGASHAAINPALVAADARWVVHVDLDGVRQSVLGRELVGLAESSRIDVGGSKVGIDVQKVLATIGSVTAYGSNFSSDPKKLDGTLILQGTPDLRKILESVLLQATIASPETVTEAADLPFPAFRIVPGASGRENAVGLVVAFPEEPIVMLSKSQPQLLNALDVFRGNAPSVASTADAPLRALVKPDSHAFLTAATVVPPSVADEFAGKGGPQARILQMTSSGTLELGEDDGSTFARASLVATSGDMADKLTKIVQGMIAMLSLAETTDRNLAQFLESAKVERDGSWVRLQIAYPSDRLITMLRSFQESARQRRADAHAAARAAQLINGNAIAEWKAQPAKAPPQGAPAETLVRTIEGVTLQPGSLLSLGRMLNGGRHARFDYVEIVPAAGGTPLRFEVKYMMRGGPRNALWLQQFPGTEGVYQLRIGYRNDPDGKASYAVSVRHPEPAEDDAKAAAP